MIMKNKDKKYIGSVQNQEEAARLFDLHAIITKGLRVSNILNIYQAKTNFSYSRNDIKDIIENFVSVIT